MKFDFENETVEQICSNLVEYFGIDLENDTISNILYKFGFETKTNYLSETTSSIVYYNPTGKLSGFNNGLGIMINKRFFDLNCDENDNIIVLRDAIRFFTRSNFDEATTTINSKRIYEEETTYKVAQDLLNRIMDSKKSSKKIIKVFVN